MVGVAGGRREIDIFLFPDLYSVLCYFFYFFLEPYGGSVGVAGGNLILFYCVLFSCFLVCCILFFWFVVFYSAYISPMWLYPWACWGNVSFYGHYPRDKVSLEWLGEYSVSIALPVVEGVVGGRKEIDVFCVVFFSGNWFLCCIIFWELFCVVFWENTLKRAVGRRGWWAGRNANILVMFRLFFWIKRSPPTETANPWPFRGTP